MLWVVLVLAVTNVVTLAAFGYRWARPAPQPRPDPRLGAALDGTLARSVTPTGTRRVISVEILNVRELAGTRGRLAGIAGSLVPGLTARIVYDQTIRTMRRQLEVEQVVADVRLHTLARLEPAKPATAPAAPSAASGAGRTSTPEASVPTAPGAGATPVDRVEATTDEGLPDVDPPRTVPPR